jgi:hypothetical protein
MATPHYCNPILESVGSSGNVATYKLLRFKGAPLGQRTLHRAFEMAAVSKKAPKIQKIHATATTGQSRVCRAHEFGTALLDVVKVDINTSDQAPGCTKGMSSAWGTPISYVLGAGMPERDSGEFTWFLLDGGADPASGLEVAKEMDNTLFVESVEAWRAKALEVL